MNSGGWLATLAIGELSELGRKSSSAVVWFNCAINSTRLAYESQQAYKSASSLFRSASFGLVSSTHVRPSVAAFRKRVSGKPLRTLKMFNKLRKAAALNPSGKM